MSTRPQGYLPDPQDERDIPLAAIPLGVTVPPARHDALARAYDQVLIQSAESCVGFGVAIGLYASWKASGIEAPELPSATFLWWNARNRHGMQRRNSGTYIREAFRQYNRIGVCPEYAWPSLGGQDLLLATRKPSPIAFRAAYDQRAGAAGYYRLAGRNPDQEFMSAISNGFPVVFGMPIARNYMELGEHRAFQENEGPIVGGHAQCALGYDEDGIFGPGTWGPGWGNRGWFHLSWSFVRRATLDRWAIRAPDYFSNER